MTSDAKRELVNFLEQRAFDPVINAHTGGRSDAEKLRLQDVQDATAAEIERFRHYRSAREVLENFSALT